jgi:hypothetical protein
LRSRWKKAFLDGAVDGVQHAGQAIARVLVQRNVEVQEIAALRTKKQPARFDGLIEQALRGEGI